MSTVRTIDNRGDKDVPFGYVYFRREEVRIGFALREGSSCDLWTQSGWGFPSDQEVEDAEAALRQAFQITDFTGPGGS